MVLFARVVHAGSFSAAARELGMPKSTLSRRIDELEASVGVQLLRRSTRGLSVTAAGGTLLEHAKHITEAISAAHAHVGQHAQGAQGRLRVTASVSLGERLLLPVLLAFAKDHPDIQLELLLTPTALDLVADGVDVAIRAGVPRDSNLVGRKLKPVQMLACASPDFLSRHAAPGEPADLRRHGCLNYGADPRWRFIDSSGAETSVDVNTRLRADSFPALAEAAVAGLGIAYLPEPFCEQALADGRLVRVLSDWSSPTMWVHAVYPSRRHKSAALDAFLAYVVRHFESADHGWETVPHEDV